MARRVGSGGFLNFLTVFLCIYPIDYFYLDGLLKSPVWGGYTWKKFVWCRLPQMGEAYVDTVVRYSQDEDSGSRVF